jgi:hypothetical protein
MMKNITTIYPEDGVVLIERTDVSIGYKFTPLNEHSHSAAQLMADSDLMGLPPGNYCKANGVVSLIPEPDNARCIFDYGAGQWTDPRTLADFKAAKWSEVKQAQRLAEYAGFTWDCSPFDSNATSQQRISSYVQLAALDPAFSIIWTLADNTARVLSGADMLAVGRALGTHIATKHAKAQALRGQIEVASTVGEVDSITW